MLGRGSVAEDAFAGVVHGAARLTFLAANRTAWICAQLIKAGPRKEGGLSPIISVLRWSTLYVGACKLRNGTCNDDWLLLEPRSGAGRALPRFGPEREGGRLFCRGSSSVFSILGLLEAAVN
jgi:hypothetical protein